MKISNNGVEFIKRHEGCLLVAYKDSTGIITIGYGHTGNLLNGLSIKINSQITQQEADELLKRDIESFEHSVNQHMKVFINAGALNQNQFDALVSFTFNCGSGNLKKLISNRSITEIGNALPLYNKAGGQVLAGLVNRRRAEKELFFTPCKENEKCVNTLNDNRKATLHSVADTLKRCHEMLYDDATPDFEFGNMANTLNTCADILRKRND